MSDDMLKGVGSGQPSPLNQPVVQKGKGETIHSLISEFLKTGDASRVHSRELSAIIDTSSQAEGLEQLGTHRVPALSLPRGKGTIPGGSSGIGNPWLQPSRSMELVNILIKVVLMNAQNKLEQGMLNAQLIQKQGESALKTGEATKEQYLEQARQSMIQAFQSFAKAAICIGAAVHSVSNEIKANKEYEKKLEEMKEGTKGAKVDDYAAAKTRLETSKQKLEELHSSTDTDPNVKPAADQLDLDQQNVDSAKTKLANSRTEMEDLKTKNNTLKTEQSKAEADLKAAETKLAEADKKLDGLKTQPAALEDDINKAAAEKSTAQFERDRFKRELHAKIDSKVDNESQQRSLQARIDPENKAVSAAEDKLKASKLAYAQAIDASSNRDIIKAKQAEVDGFQEAFNKEKVPGVLQYEQRIKELETEKADHLDPSKGPTLKISDPAATGKTTDSIVKELDQKIDTYNKMKQDRAKEADIFKDSKDTYINRRATTLNDLSRNASEAAKGLVDGVAHIQMAQSKAREGDARMLEIIYQNYMQQLQKLMDGTQASIQSFGDTISGLMQSLQSLYQVMKQLGTPYNVR